MKINNSALLIVAAGKSSRFGGYPKALCNIGDMTNVENTIALASNYFENIYLGLNVETKTDINVQAKILQIETGQGDSLSLLRLIRLIKQENKACLVVNFVFKACFHTPAVLADPQQGIWLR